jgi:hypothetical protein
MSYRIVPAGEWEIRRRFNARFLEPEKHGYLAIPEPGAPPGPNAPEDAVLSRTIIYVDRFGNPQAEAHEFRRADGSIAASGMPDPKRVLEGNTLYVLDPMIKDEPPR